MLAAGAGAARGYLMARGITLDDDGCHMLGMLVIQAAFVAWGEAYKEIPEPKPKPAPASTRGHIFGSHELDFNTGKCPCGVTQIELEDALASKDCPLAKA